MNQDEQWYRQVAFTPNGSQTLSKMPNRYVNNVYPKLIERGNKGHVLGSDGKEYIDLIAGLGCISLGYNDETVNHAVVQQVLKGPIFSLPNKLEADVAEKLCGLLPSTDMWKFFPTGTEANMAAVKLARAHTNRLKVMVCSYHGWADWYTVSTDKKAGIPEFNAALITKAKYNDIKSFSPLDSKDYACVIMEPMVYDTPFPGFLDFVRQKCDETGTLLIFDEVVTGGRYEKFFASNYFSVRPDITTVGKGLANGFHMAAVGARRGLMQVFERDDFFASGTFGGSCISLSACLATLNRLQTEIKRMIKNGERIKDLFNSIYVEKGAICRGYPTRLTFDFPTPALKALFMQEMCLAGVLVGYSNFLMALHDDNDITAICTAIFYSSEKVLAHWSNPKEILRGDLPVEPLRMR